MFKGLLESQNNYFGKRETMTDIINNAEKVMKVKKTKNLFKKLEIVPILLSKINISENSPFSCNNIL